MSLIGPQEFSPESFNPSDGGGWTGGVKDFFSNTIKGIDNLAESNVAGFFMDYFTNKENNNSAEQIAEYNAANRYQAHSPVVVAGKNVAESASQEMHIFDNAIKYWPIGAVILGLPIILYFLKK